MKFYGGGIASSAKEIENAMTCADLRPLRLYEKNLTTDLVIDDIQPFFYYIERWAGARAGV